MALAKKSKHTHEVNLIYLHSERIFDWIWYFLFEMETNWTYLSKFMSSNETEARQVRKKKTKFTQTELRQDKPTSEDPDCLQRKKILIPGIENQSWESLIS